MTLIDNAGFKENGDEKKDCPFHVNVSHALVHNYKAISYYIMVIINHFNCIGSKERYLLKAQRVS